MRRFRVITMVVVALILSAATTTRWRFTETPPENFFLYDPAEVEISGGTAKLRAHTPWFHRDWKWRKPITIVFNPDPNQPAEFQTITNYIFRVQIDTTPIFDDFWSSVNPNGLDVRFVDAAGIELTYYRESFIYLPPSDRFAVYYVKIPQLVPGTTRIYLYFNNPNAIDVSQSNLTFFADGVQCLDLTPGDPNDPTICPAMKYYPVQLPTNQYCETPGPNCPQSYVNVQLSPGGEEGNIQIAVGDPNDDPNEIPNFFFPFYGKAYNFLKVNINGCVHPYYDNPQTPLPEQEPMGLGGSGGGGDALWPYPCGWSSEFFTKNIIPYRLIIPYARDLTPVGIYPFYKMFISSANPLVTPHEFRVRWVAQLANWGGTNRFVLRLFSNGHMQFDYGPNSTTSLRKGARVGISSGDETNFLFPFPDVYDYANPSNARSLRIFAMQEGNPAPTITLGPAEKFFSFRAPTVVNLSPRPFYFSLLSFEEILGGFNEGQVKYQLSPNGTDWYYVDTSRTPPQWLPAPEQSPKYANMALEISDNIELFPGVAGLGQFIWKAFLISDGEQRVVLDELRVTYSNALTDVLLFLDNQWKGENVYNASGFKQTYLSVTPRGATLVIPLQVQNDGNATDTFTLTGSGPIPGWDVQYYSAPTGGLNITTSVIAGTYSVVLPPGQSRILRAEVTPLPNLPAGSEYRLSLTSNSTVDTAVSDTAVAQLVLETLARIDGVIALLQDFSDRVGEDIIDPTGASQSKSSQVKNFQKAIYYLRFRNTGTIRQNTVLWSNSVIGFNWNVQIFDQLIGGNDITSEVFSSLGYSIALGIMEEGIFRVEVTPTERVLGGDFPLELVFSLQQERERTTFDAVKAITQIIPFYQPDLIYQAIGEPPFGEDVYSPDGTGQTLNRELSPGRFQFFITVQNDGNLRDFLIFKAPPPPLGWNITFFDAVQGGNDISSSVLGAGYSFTMNPFIRQTIRGELSAPAEATFPYSLILTLDSFNYRQQYGETLRDLLLVNFSVSQIYQPDLKISRTPTFDPQRFLGNDLYDPNQILGRSAGSGTPATFYIMLENDGNVADRFVLKGPAGDADWDVRYFDAFTGGLDITSDVTTSGWITAIHEPQTFTVYRFEIEPKRELPIGFSYSATLQALSLTLLENTDQVTGIGRITYGVDAMVSSQADLSDVVGQFILDPTGERQTMTRSTRIGSPITYYFTVTNPSVDDSFELRITETPEPSWEAHYFSAPVGGAEITSLITTVGWRTPQVERGALFTIRAEVFPLEGTPPLSTKTISMSARSISSFAEVDLVRAVTRATSEFQLIYAVDLVISGQGRGERGAPNSGSGGSISLVSGWQSEHRFPLEVVHIGQNPDRFVLSWNIPLGWEVLLTDGTNLYLPGFLTPPLNPGASVSYDVIARLPIGSNEQLIQIFLNASSISEPNETDSVGIQFRVLARRFGVDLAIDNKGFGEFGPNGEGGSIRKSIPGGSASSFPLNLFNNGNLPTSYLIRWNTPPGWNVSLRTPQPQGSPYVTPSVQPGVSIPYLLSVEPPLTFSYSTIILEAVSTDDLSALDSVRLELSPGETGVRASRGSASPVGELYTQPGTVNLSILQTRLDAIPSGFPVQVSDMTLRFSGSGNFVRDITAVKIWQDLNQDGIPDGTRPLATSSVTSSGRADFSFSPSLTLSPGSPVFLVTTLDFAPVIARGQFPVFLLLGSLLIFGLVGFRWKRALGIWLLIAIVSLGLFTCKAGAPVTPDIATWSYQASLQNTTDLTAQDAQTSAPALVVIEGAPIQSALVRIRK